MAEEKKPTDEERKPTDVGAWRAQREEGETVVLPSGNVARLRRVHILDLAERGEIPTPLVGIVVEMIGKGEIEITPENLSEYVEVINLVVQASFAEPEVGKERGPDRLGIEEIEMPDRLAVFQWCHPVRVRLRKFRPQS